MVNGTWHKPTFAPLAVRAGDVLRIEPSGKLGHYRNGTKINERTLTLPGPEVSLSPADGTPVTAGDTLTSIYFFKEQKMPGVIETLTKVTKNSTTGVVKFKFDDVELEFADEAAALAEVSYLDTDPEVVRHMLILKTLRNSPDFTNLENMVGASCSLDLQANVPCALISQGPL